MTDYQDWEEPVDWRIGRLEESQRRLMWWVGGLSLMLLAGLLATLFSLRPRGGTIRAQKFQLVSASGKVVGEFSSSPLGTRLIMQGERTGGTLLLKVSADGGPQFTLETADGKKAARLREDDNGNLSLWLGAVAENGGHVSVHTSGDDSGVEWWGKEDGGGGMLFTGFMGAGMILLNGEAGDMGLAMLSVSEEGYPRFSFGDGDRTTMQLVSWEGGNTGLFLYGEDKEAGVALQTASEGGSSLMLRWDWQDGEPLSRLQLSSSAEWGAYLRLEDGDAGKGAAITTGGESGAFLGLYELGGDWTALFPDHIEQPAPVIGAHPAEADTAAPTAGEE